MFAQFQAEVMTETRRCRVLGSFVCHTSMSVGDLLLDEARHLFAVTPVGFKRVRPDTLESYTELALHLLALGLEKTPGWCELFEQERGATGGCYRSAAPNQRLRDCRLCVGTVPDSAGVGGRAMIQDKSQALDDLLAGWKNYVFDGLGKARAAALRSEALDEKIVLYRHVKEVEQEIEL